MEPLNNGYKWIPMPIPFGRKYGISASLSLTNIYQIYGGDYMSEQNKQLTAELSQAMENLPEEVRAEFQKKWTEQAIGARIVSEMANNQPG